MVSKEMKRKGIVVKELSTEKYREAAGKIRKLLPRHIDIEIERVKEGKKKKVKLWCKNPAIAKVVINEALKQKKGGKTQ